MIAIRVRKNFDVGKMVRAIPRETAVLLNDIAEATIVDIHKGVSQGVDVKDKPFVRLTKATLAAKRKKGQPTTILVGDNKMVGVGVKGGRRGIYVKVWATAAKLLARVSTADATPYAVYHQKGEGYNPVREWFDYSRRMLKKTDLLIRAAQERIVRAGDTPMR